MNPQRDMIQSDFIPGSEKGVTEVETSEKKKRNVPHYKEMYESAMKELHMQRKVNIGKSLVSMIGWGLFFISLVYIIMTTK